MRRTKASVSTLIVAILALVLATGAAGATELHGRVVGISDGDTLTVLTPERRQVRVRLAEIDTPERAQPYGNRAQQELSELAFGKEVRVVVTDTDRYGRTVGRVHAGTTDVNAEMIARGAAWVYRQYSRDAALLRLEFEARAARRGLWALPEAERTPPWEWRAAGRGGATPLSPGVGSGDEPSDGRDALHAAHLVFRRVPLRGQALLPGDDVLHRGHVLPAPVRRLPSGRRRGRRALRAALPLTGHRAPVTRACLEGGAVRVKLSHQR